MRALLSPLYGLIGRLGVYVALGLIWLCYVIAAVAALYAGEGTWVVAAGVAAFAFATWLTASFALWTTTGMRRLARIAERIASGDLSRKIQVEGMRRETAESIRLFGSIAKMSDNLGGIVTQVRASAETIERGAREVPQKVRNIIIEET